MLLDAALYVLSLRPAKVMRASLLCYPEPSPYPSHSISLTDRQEHNQPASSHLVLSVAVDLPAALPYPNHIKSATFSSYPEPSPFLLHYPTIISKNFTVLMNMFVY